MLVTSYQSLETTSLQCCFSRSMQTLRRSLVLKDETMADTLSRYKERTYMMFKDLRNSILEVEPVFREPRHNVSTNDIRTFAKSLVVSCNDKNWEDLGEEIGDETPLQDGEAELALIHRNLLHIVSMHAVPTSRRREHDDSTNDADVYALDKAISGNIDTSISITNRHDDIVNKFTDTHLPADDADVLETSVRDSTETNKTKVTWNQTIVYIDKSETETDYVEFNEDTCSINDTLEKDSNATDEDIARFSDLSSDIEDYSNLDDLNVQNELNPDEYVEEYDDDDDCMCGMFGVYTRGQGGVSFI